MSGFIKGDARTQATFFPEILDDYIVEENAVRVIDVFIDGIALLAERKGESRVYVVTEDTPPEYSWIHDRWPRLRKVDKEHKGVT